MDIPGALCYIIKNKQRWDVFFVEFLQMLIFVVLSAIAVSYGWGMRGTVLGGEKGAMLPGAIMGLLIAFFSGSEVLKENFFMVSAVGALGMYFGGAMTYGETLGLSMNEKPAENMKKGLIALFVKGAIWFGIFGSCVGIFLTASTGRLYTVKDFLILFALLPVFALGFYFLLNKPHKPKEDKLPKIYFSKTRQECWGGLLGIFVLFVGFMAFKGDRFALWLTLGSLLSGAIGWVIGQIFQIRMKHPGKNGKRVFEGLHKKKLSEPWKMMECTFGAIGGAGVALTLYFLRGDMAGIAQALRANGGLWSPLPAWADWVAYGWLALLSAALVFTVIAKKAKGEKAKKRLKNYDAIEDTLSFPLYCVIPLFFVFTGQRDFANLTSFLVLFVVIVQEILFTEFNKLKIGVPLQVLSLAGFAAIAVANMAFDWIPGSLLTAILYGVYYEALSLLEIYARVKAKGRQGGTLFERYGGVVPVHTFFCIAVVIFAVSAVYWL